MSEAQKYPQYFRLHGHCLKRDGEVAAREVRLPEPPNILPLSMGDIIYPSKERLDEQVAKMEVVDQECWHSYILGFIGGVERDIKQPMTEYGIKNQLKTNNKTT